MIQLVAPLAAVAALGGMTHSLLKSGWRAARSRRASLSRRRLSPEEIRQCIVDFGMSANGFMTLYPGFEYFAHPDSSVRGVIGYVDTPQAWVGGAEPFCAPETRESLLAEYAKAAAAVGKTAMMLPVDEAHAEVARKAGYRAVMIGSEPTFKLDRYPRTGRTWVDIVPTAKTLSFKGAKVTEFWVVQLTPAERADLDEMTAEWLSTRKMDALGFLNQVDPWFRSEDKRYFVIEYQGRKIAFLAAVPIWARKGWYLIDLIRRTDTPAGSTELLLLQTMRLLRESGALEASMGLAPLSNISTALNYACVEPEKTAFAYKLLALLYEYGDALYNFKPLYQYKLKFDPSISPPSFLIYKPTLGVRGLLNLARACIPGGMARATWSGGVRFVTHFNLPDWIRQQLSSKVVVRSVPPSWLRLLQRCKLTVALLTLNLGMYFATVDSAGRLPPEFEARWGFSWTVFLQQPLHALVLSPFLHWNLIHLLSNLLVLVIFTGGLEYLAGSGITAFAYFIPMLLANPLTAALLSWINPGDIDIGASLGIFGCAGALHGFIRWGRPMLALLIVGAIADAFIAHSYLPVNHVIAIALGAVVGRWALKD